MSGKTLKVLADRDEGQKTEAVAFMDCWCGRHNAQESVNDYAPPGWRAR